MTGALDNHSVQVRRKRPRPSRRVRQARGVVLLVVLIAVIVVVANALGGSSDSPPLQVFPVPGGRVAAPETQITFRGMPIAQVGHVTVTGSRSGVHDGRLASDSDHDGGSFLPKRPFTPGETVTVRLGSALIGTGSHRLRTYHFSVANPAGQVPHSPLPLASRTAGDVQEFHSRPDLKPPAVQVHTTAAAQRGDIFLANQAGPLQNGPMIIDEQGALVWYHPLSADSTASDFRVQRYQGHPVLTWWQGYEGAGVGVGEDVIYDTSYRQIAVVHAGNGLSADLHEFQLTPAGTALITAYYPVYWDTRSVHGPKDEIVMDSVVQEIDIKTGLVVFQWDSLDHVSIKDSYLSPPSVKGHPYDYFHINTAEPDADGGLLISARNTWATYKVDPHSAQTMWVMGGKHSTFFMNPGAQYVFQHDFLPVGSGDRLFTVFDDGAGPPIVHKESRALLLRLSNDTVSVVAQFTHSPGFASEYEGSVQTMANGDEFVGWGQFPYFNEYTRSGKLVFDGKFVDTNSSYRAYRLPWRGTPRTVPEFGVSQSGSTMQVYASWNGATDVASWRVLTGSSPGALSPARTAAKSGFETQLTVSNASYVAVQALSASGQVLSTSATRAASAAT
jgi:hypothetical protein